MRTILSLLTCLALLAFAGDLDYYCGNDFAALRPVAASAMDAAGNASDGLAVILDRPTLLFDPAANSFEQRVILKYRIPDFAQELQNRLLHRALLMLDFAGANAVDAPPLLATARCDSASKITSADFSASSRGGRSRVTRLSPGQRLELDVTNAVRKAKTGDILTLAIQIPEAEERVELPFKPAPVLELRLAKQIHLMRNGVHRGRMAAPLDNHLDWELQLREAPEDAKATLSTTTEFTFYGTPALKVDCHNLDASTELLLTPKQPIYLGSGFDMMELWSWSNQFGYGIGRTIRVSIRDANGKAHVRDLAMKLAVWGPFPHLCDFNAPGAPFDSSQSYTLESISVRNFSGTPADAYFGLGPVLVYPKGQSDLSISPLPTPPPSVPESMVPPVANATRNVKQVSNGEYRFTASSPSGTTVFTCRPVTGTLADFTITCGEEHFIPMMNGGLRSASRGASEKEVSGKLLDSRLDSAKGILTLVWQDSSASRHSYTWTVQLLHRSLVIDISGDNPNFSGVSLGYATGMSQPELLNFPYFWFNGVKNGRFGPAIVHSNGVFFYGGMDFFLSNANDFYSDSRIEEGKILYNGGSNYMPLSDYSRLPLRDRVILSASTKVHEVFPNIPTTVIHDTAKARDFYFWGINCVDENRVRLLKAMGLDHLFLWLFWTKSPADNQIDRAVRNAHGDPSPFSYQSGKDATPCPELFRGINHRDYAQNVRNNGNLFGIYTYYTDATPNLFDFDPNALQRNFQCQPEMGCLGGYRLRPDCIPGHQRKMAESIREHWGQLDGVYSDVLTIRPFWGGAVDLEPGHPFSGKSFFAAYAALARQELEANGGLCYSEGHLQWLYAGLTSGSYGSLMTRNPQGPSTLPMLPEFTARCIAPKSVLVGMSPAVYQFFARAAQKLPHGNFRNEQVRQFYATLLGYGNAGLAIDWDVSYMTHHGVAKEYYLLHNIQRHYLLQEIDRIEYWDGQAFLDTSDAIRTKAYLKGRLRKIYRNGTVVHVNYQDQDDWKITVDGQGITLGPWGFHAVSGDGQVRSCAIRLEDGHRIEYSSSPDELFLDSWENPTSVPGLAIDGAGCVRKTGNRELTFYPLGPMSNKQELPNMGVREATIDLAHFFPDITEAAVSAEGVRLDGSHAPFPVQCNGLRIRLCPDGGFYHFRIRF